MTQRPLRVTIGTVATTVGGPNAPGEEATGSDPVIGAVGAIDRDGRRRMEIVVDGWRFEAIVEDAARAELLARATRGRGGAGAVNGPLEIRAIIPGRIVDVRVTVDDNVEAGQALLVVEAMKMQNELRSPRAGVVARVAATVGATVEIGDLLVVLG